MNRVFIDLEMHPIPFNCKEERQICTQEIIEVGAVMLNDKNEEIVVDLFNQLHKDGTTLIAKKSMQSFKNSPV